MSRARGGSRPLGEARACLARRESGGGFFNSVAAVSQTVGSVDVRRPERRHDCRVSSRRGAVRRSVASRFRTEVARDGGGARLSAGPGRRPRADKGSGSPFSRGNSSRKRAPGPAPSADSWPIRFAWRQHWCGRIWPPTAAVSMLAVELMHFAIRTMWDERRRCFRDRVERRRRLALRAQLRGRLRAPPACPR